MRPHFLPFLLAAALPLSGSSPASAPALPVTSVPVYPQQTITPDGVLNEPGWRQAGTIEAFILKEGGSPQNATSVRLFSDGKYLNIAFICKDDRIADLKRGGSDHDGAFWNDDAVEIFFDPLGTGAAAMHFAINAAGTRFDAMGNDTHGWNPKWEAAVAVQSDHWIVEARIPLKEISAKGFGPGDELRGNFTRIHGTSRELTCWSNAYGGWSAPNGMGTLVFGNVRTAAARRLQSMEAELQRVQKLAASGPAYADTVHKAEKLLETLKTSLPQVIDQPAYQSVTREHSRFQELVAEVYRQQALNQHRDRGYVVWENPEWQLSLPQIDYAALSSGSKPVALRLLRGQSEYRSILIANVMNETLELFVSLRLPGVSHQLALPAYVRTFDHRVAPDALLPPDNMQRLTIPSGEQREIWVEVTGSEAGEFEGELQLIPIAGSFTDTSLPIHVRVAPGDASAFLPDSYGWSYLGSAVALGLGDAFQKSLIEHHSKWITIQGLRDIPRPGADDDGAFTEPLDWSKLEAILDRSRKQVLEGGGLFFVSLDIWEKRVARDIFNRKHESPGWEAAFKRWVGAIVDKLKSSGFDYRHFIFNPMDESVDERYLKLATLIREVDPNVRLLCNSARSVDDMEASKLDTLADIYMPHRSQLISEEGQRRLQWMMATGKPVGFYFYSEGNNEKIRDSYHNIFWWHWYAHAIGLRKGPFGYWSMTQLYGDAWNRHKTPKVLYDVSLIYPGNGIAIPSRRLEAWKRSMEDIALLEAVEARIAQAENADTRAAMQAIYHQALIDVVGIDPKSFEQKPEKSGFRKLRLVKSAREIPSSTLRTAREALVDLLAPNP